MWNQKNVIDLWTILHFCFGLILGSFAGILNINIILGIALTLIAAVGWEIYERKKRYRRIVAK